ncbi:hypothetical protein BJ912DRAFT_283054 [Pholiota molesta]|nr:hypothetical protein BJ912DRAFT_283054 [Pholiota molesta]
MRDAHHLPLSTPPQNSTNSPLHIPPTLSSILYSKLRLTSNLHSTRLAYIQITSSGAGRELSRAREYCLYRAEIACHSFDATRDIPHRHPIKHSLWIPEPNRTLPMPYRRKGIDIGDVGIITPSGGFSFLFDICLPPDHPINPPTLPEGFTPINQLMNIREYLEFRPESHLASGIKKVRDPRISGLSFETLAMEGAVLTMPDGVISCNLLNILLFREYAAANIENWYRNDHE